MLTFPELRSLTDAVTRQPTWRGPAVLVSALSPAEDASGVVGKTTGRVVRYSPHRAPACAVPHELAHVVRWPDVDHDAAWAAEYVKVGSLVADQLTLMLAGRGTRATQGPPVASP